MKNIVFPRILKIFIASVIFISCSKEELTVSNSVEAKGGGITYPVHFGGMTGKLSPVPFYAGLKIYNDEQGSVTTATPDAMGRFTVTDLYPGTYRILITYVPMGAPPDDYRNFEVRGIIVQSDMVTDVGEIILPNG